MLSRLADEKNRPELSELGEMVKAALRAVHRVWAAATISDYVIMPDHIHYLLIVDYSRDQLANPLFIAHRIADAVEMAAAEAEERTGAPAPEPLERPLGGNRAPAPLRARAAGQDAVFNAVQANGAAFEKQLAEERAAKMAELLKSAIEAANRRAAAGSLRVESGLRFGELAGDCAAIGKAAGDCAAIGGAAGGTAIGGAAGGTAIGGAAGGAGAGAPVRSVVFARDCYIELSFDSRQLKAIRHYIKLNPARALWKLRNPDLFLCHRALKAHRLAPLAPMSFDGIGALTLLGSPFLFHVRLTLKKTVAEHAAAIEEIVEKARRGMIPVSGFISPGEKEALRQLKADPRARFVKLLPCALPPRYDPSAEDSREIAAGRMLILSPFRETPAIASLEMKRNPSAAHAFRRNCLAMNDIAAKLCGE